ncbi:GGDEF domain-containing protein [Leptothrix discophora]|uniref:diguanylate cyclase n=1 Tax=Leptothrix discophora TaxID=89 RepID=A0ABT9FYN6_LEPDI|nr:GGDEF domain-containing protein [Leptothrix discophora]MDP4299360.1 GGDEF domain-containing protein [Leptothrix discophora]
MFRPYAAFIDYFGAHRGPLRVRHEVDRAIQRVVIGLLVALATLWHDHEASQMDLVVHAMPYFSVAYALLALLYWRVIRARPDAAVAAQYAFIVADPVLTVLALAASPTLLAPLNMFLMVQIVRCGIRYGVRTLWLEWSVAVLASALLLPLSAFWTLAQPLTQSHIAMLLVTPLLFAPLIRQLHRANDELRAAATSDPLTGLGNRRLLSEHLRIAQERSRRDGTWLALILFDLDNFKAVNDARGHASGDALLLHITRALRANLRGGDYLARIGGDEFVLLVEGLPADEAGRLAQAMADKIVRVVAEAARDASPDQPVTASAGVHCWSGSDPTGHDEATPMERADQAMYEAKRAGKDRAVATQVATLG